MIKAFGTGISGPRKTTPWRREGDVERRTGPCGVETRCPACRRAASGYTARHYHACRQYVSKDGGTDE
jgi:hypothetical protein